MPEPGEGEVRRESGRRVSRRADLGKVLDEVLGAAPASAAAKTLSNSVGMAFVLVPAGKFLMGSPPDEVGHRANEGPVHEVVVGNAFYLGVHLVTQAVYLAVTGKNPARFSAADGGGPEHPVESVSWDDAVAFGKRPSERPEERLNALRVAVTGCRPKRSGSTRRAPEPTPRSRSAAPSRRRTATSTPRILTERANRARAPAERRRRPIIRRPRGAARRARQRLGMVCRLVRRGVLFDTAAARPAGADRRPVPRAARRELAQPRDRVPGRVPQRTRPAPARFGHRVPCRPRRPRVIPRRVPGWRPRVPGWCPRSAG